MYKPNYFDDTIESMNSKGSVFAAYFMDACAGSLIRFNIKLLLGKKLKQIRKYHDMGAVLTDLYLCLLTFSF